jgi:beta-galactosidase/beta-glucuronidase
VFNKEFSGITKSENLTNKINLSNPVFWTNDEPLSYTVEFALKRDDKIGRFNT